MEISAFPSRRACEKSITFVYCWIHYVMYLHLQAMDRAHRLGQRKVVNVHRLIMRGTMEERKMNLQEFKLMVANAVINAENASLKTMNTDQLLDLFTTAETKKVWYTIMRLSSFENENGIRLINLFLMIRINLFLEKLSAMANWNCFPGRVA